MANWTQQQVAAVCDYEIHQATMSEKEVLEACREAKRFEAAAVCINGSFVRLAAKELDDSNVKVSGYISFPFGGCAIESKRAEAAFLEQEGADEIDFVISVGRLREKQFDYIQEECQAILDAVSIPVKAIIECNYLDDDFKIKACEIIKKTNIAFVSSNTGYPSNFATISDISLMHQCLGDAAGVKACGGIMTLNDLTAMLEAGASRVGVERFTEIMRQAGE